MALVGYQNSIVRAREAVLKEDLFRLRDAIDQYYADKNKWPQALQDLVTDGYVREDPRRPDDQLASRRGRRCRPNPIRQSARPSPASST